MHIQNYHSILAKVKQKNATLIAVSKNKSSEAILALYHLGQKDFGENYVQELLQKQNLLPKDIRWHFIGHLQRNKVKNILPLVHCIQSVDSKKLLQEIEKEATKMQRKLQVFLQIFIAQETTKFGLSFDEAKEILHAKPHELVEISGLMGMASNTQDENKIEEEMQQLHHFFLQQHQKNKQLRHLSMGMSNDYEIALKCGSNMIRIGSAVFGERTTKTA